MEKMTLADLLIAVDGTLLGNYQNSTDEIRGVEIDSRKVKALDVFFALIGENHDAHSFVDTVTEGAGFVISQELRSYQKDKFYVLVKDTQKALGDLAKWYRNLFQIPFIAVTGSVGKTTTKDMIASVLSEQYLVHKTQGNFNNTIGLPLTLLQLEKKHEICVLEMGMDTFGEIDYMANIVKPDVAVITNIGDAHIQRLGSREGIRKAKFELLQHIQTQGLFLYNFDDEMLDISYQDYPFSAMGIAVDGQEGHYQVCQKDGISWDDGKFILKHRETGEEQLVNVPTLGKYIAYAVLFSVEVAEKFGLSPSAWLKGISAYKPSKMRMNIEKLAHSITIIDDTYNANPQSMASGLEILSRTGGKQKVAVLSDMLELGDISKSAHEAVGRLVSQLQIDVLVTVGQQGKFVANSATESGMKQVYAYDSKENAFTKLQEFISSDTTFFFKASRGMALDELALSVNNYVKEKHLT